MLKNFLEHIDIDVLGWVFLALCAIIAIWEIVAQARKRKMAQRALNQWLTNENTATPFPNGFWAQEEEELRKIMKFEAKLLIPLLPVLVALALVCFCRWWMGWSIPATIGIFYASLIIGVIIMVWIIQVLPNKEKA